MPELPTTVSPRKKTRVLLISHTCISRTEGQPKAEWLACRPDIELRVLVPDRWFEYGRWRTPQPPEGGAFAYQIGKTVWPWAGPAQWYLHWYPCLAQTLREFQPDIIDLWEEPWGLVSALTCLLRNRLVPHAKIISETEQNTRKFLPFPFEAFRSYSLRNAAFAVGRNAEAIEILREKGYRGPAEVIPNAADIHLFRPLDRAVCRRKLGLSGFVAGYLGRLVEEKGLMDMVEALSLCPPAVQLLFVGSGPFQGALEQRVQEKGLTGRVRFLPSRPMNELAEVMNALDTLVLPSHTTPRWKEQFGRVIIEAHACQTPVIGSNSGAIPDVVGQGGLIFPERDPAALASALMELLADPARREEMGLLGRRQVEEKYSWEQVASGMYRIYSTLTASAPCLSP